MMRTPVLMEVYNSLEVEVKDFCQNERKRKFLTDTFIASRLLTLGILSWFPILNC